MKSGKMGSSWQKKNSMCEGLEAIKGGVLNCIFIGPKQSSMQGGEEKGVRLEGSVGPCLATLNMDVIYAPEQIKEQINEQMIAEFHTLFQRGQVVPTFVSKLQSLECHRPLALCLAWRGLI